MFSAFSRRRIQSQHNRLEKELAEHTIDNLKYSNIRIIEKVRVERKHFVRFCFDFPRYAFSVRRKSAEHCNCACS